MEHDDVSVADLVAAAARGDRAAWDDLVTRFTPLVLSVARRHRIVQDDAADIAQTVWLRLLDHLRDLRDPEALPGWLVTTTRNECLRLAGRRLKTVPFDPLQEPHQAERYAQVVDFDADLQRAERREALLTGLAQLPDHARRLLLLLLADPPLSYAQISDRLGIPVGSIGPTRARALVQLRQTPALAALLRTGDMVPGASRT